MRRHQIIYFFYSTCPHLNAYNQPSVSLCLYLLFLSLPKLQMNRLNDSHAQLMVHWLGEGTDVMLCLAREPPPSYLDDPKLANVPPSSVYISYDNGDTFHDKTLMFTVNVTTANGSVTVEKKSTLDQFITHPSYNTVCTCSQSCRIEISCFSFRQASAPDVTFRISNFAF